MRHLLSKPILLLAIVISAAGCGSDSNSAGIIPTGNYSAISFVTTGSSGQRNEITSGSTLQLVLAPNGATSGHLHIAASNATPAFDADMAGTWTASGNVVTISQAADTFVRDMPLTLSADPVNGWILSGDKIFSGTRVQLTLQWQATA
jgi:hypothetical protein